MVQRKLPFFLTCLATQRSEQPADLWQLKWSSEHSRVIRKVQQSWNTAGLHVPQFQLVITRHKSHCSLERTVLYLYYISQHALGLSRLKDT